MANKLIERGLSFYFLSYLVILLGLGENITVKLNRGSRIFGSPKRYSDHNGVTGLHNSHPGVIVS